MWIRLIDNSDPITPRVFEYAEGVLSTCDYRIHSNGQVNITLHKDGFTPELNLESAMLTLMQKDYFDVELYSGTVIVKTAKCRIKSYNMGTGDSGNLKERVELSVLVEGIDYNFVSPSILEATYNLQDKTLTLMAQDLVRNDNGVYYFDTTKMSVCGVSLTPSSVVKTVQTSTFSIQISEEDYLRIEESRKLGASPVFKTVLGWNSSRAHGTSSDIIIVQPTSKTTESGSTEGLSS